MHRADRLEPLGAPSQALTNRSPPITELFPILDAALADTTIRSGEWLACKPGCHQCCIGVFPISQLDAETLRTGLAAADPAVAHRIGIRVEAARSRLSRDFPGDPATGLLFTEPHHEEAFDDFANEEPCPVLDPVTGTCDLYAFRPVQCRTFGPPVRNEDDGLGVCELCFIDAPASEVARCEMDQSWRPLEEKLSSEAEQRTGLQGPTIIAFALAQLSTRSS
ncbi:YkgJ family cysteine cluster protein [Granulicella mallensis]|uniref:Fe-S-cluster containining protein n=1 Tax=Granulicella mallensis TaxID=940614 RepID=A0A7W7ZL11_9BACT|nr:YkgJ family cysteine cluster protein [Granulicella mallensis]MBB5061692.1 Fe-S-cluster containining protein [Granulicella mallensis]